MLTSLLRSIDPNRALELVDFLVLFLFFVAVAFAVLYALAMARARKTYRELARSAEEVYYNLLPTLALNAEEHALIKRMAAFLVFPQQRQRIVTNPQIFEECAAGLVAQNPAEEAAVSALRSKLGYREDRGGELPGSSTELPVGMPIVLAQGARAQTRGIVVRNTDAALMVRLEARTPAPSLSGIPCTAYCQNRAGLFSFATEVTRQDGLELELRHSEEIKRYLRREHFRKRIHLPVSVRPTSRSGAAAPSVFIDLSGGGAALRNPEGRFKAADRIELAFSVDDERFTVPGRVLRTSKSGAVMHVRFDGATPETRSRIVGLLKKTQVG